MNKINLEDVIMHGAGNRFLLHFGQEHPMELMQQHERLDGVLSIHESTEADFEMHICNADGSPAEQCGNGLRCVALHAVRSKFVLGTEVSIKTISGVNYCEVVETRNEVSVLLLKPTTGASSCNVTTSEGLPSFQFVHLGNPNAVLWIEDDPLEIRAALGEQFSNHPAFSEGMNIHFARRDDLNHATCASFERGVGPTLASGTGGAAVFVSANSTEPFRVSSQGGTLLYEYTDGDVVKMTGPASYE